MTEPRSHLASESQGKIKTENVNLAALLRDSPKDGMSTGTQPGEKVYVDWPEKDDDFEYRFVSSRVDDYEHKDKVREVENEQDRTYVLRDQSAQGRSGNEGGPEPTLEHEADYQNKLLRRIEENSLKDAQLEIPKLDLDALRDSAQDFVGDSLDVISVRSTNPGHESPLPVQNFERDSLDVGDLVDSLDLKPEAEFAAVDSSRKPPPRETIVRPPPYGKEESHRNQFEMEKYNRGRHDQQIVSYHAYRPDPDYYRPPPQGQGYQGQGQGQGQAYQGQGHVSDRWEELDGPEKGVMWSDDQRRASPAPYAGRVEYAHEPEPDMPEGAPDHKQYSQNVEKYPVPGQRDQHKPLPPGGRYEDPVGYEEPQGDPVRRYEKPRVRAYEEPPVRAYEEPPVMPVRQYEEPQVRQYEEARVRQYQEPQVRQYQEPRVTQPHHYEYVDPRQNEPPPHQERRPLPEKRAHFHNDYYSQQVAFDQERRQGELSQRVPTPYQDMSQPGMPQPDESFNRGSIQEDLGIYNDESESEPSGLMMRSQNELERDLEELYQNRKGKPRRLLQNDEQYSQLLQEKPRDIPDRNAGDDPKKSPQKSPMKETSTDYVETNKQTYGKGPKRTYGRLFERRKEDVIVTRRGPKNVSNSAGPLSDHDEHVGPDVQKPVKPASAEEVWSQRTKQLQQKMSGKSKKLKQPERGVLEKYPSEGSVSDAVLKHQHVPVPNLQRVEVRTRAEPHMMAPYQPGTNFEAQPVQAVWSDDGQKVSLDINLKLVSPTPHTKPPLPPVGSDNTSHVGTATQVNRMYNYPYSDPYALDGLTPRDHLDDDLSYSSQYSAQQFSPYRALPPISQEAQEGSYVAQYQRAKQTAYIGAQYKPYSLTDYKKMQKEVKLGGLGPDLDNETHKEKLEKKMRQQEYARQIHMKNTQEIHKKRSPPKPEQDSNPFSPNLASKRQLAIEYSKQLRKGEAPITFPPQQKIKTPTKKPSKKNPSVPLRPAPQGGSPTSNPSTTRGNQAELIDLSKLLQQHQRDKENVTAIRQNLGGTSLASKV